MKWYHIHRVGAKMSSFAILVSYLCHVCTLLTRIFCKISIATTSAYIDNLLSVLFTKYKKNVSEIMSCWDSLAIVRRWPYDKKMLIVYYFYFKGSIYKFKFRTCVLGWLAVARYRRVHAWKITVLFCLFPNYEWSYARTRHCTVWPSFLMKNYIFLLYYKWKDCLQ